ncbi:ABC transporter ATP-binding protein [Reichenbachiella ulvae]|uniref:ABC transporter ATP-binding protein n=1 Tax=Reichenbachiella ulvae TaxID=2980104 RepID=A0ABT3CVZ4_9BACT|nr:ABC transporter ATP-binding protein [Reichenbachiella ulvae]MCV9387880.1 ABC transporter ATP-binding protein [Reichenbachiella ulvae]
MIAVKNISKAFGSLQVLDKISFDLKKGGIFAVLGPNGSGKTTFLKILLGMVLPDSGEIYYQDQPILQSHAYRKHIGYLPQIARFPDNLKVREIIHMIMDIREEPAHPEPLIELFKLDKFMDKKLGDLSGGTRQKVNIVLTFMFDTPVVVLDEPTAGLDPVSLIKLKDLLHQAKNQGKMILITSHIMSLVEELADEVIFLLEGKIYFQGTLSDLQSKTETRDLEHSIAAILEP